MAATKIRITSTPAAQQKYRQLLKADWSSVTLKETIAFLRNQLAAAGLYIQFSWETPPKTTSSKKEIHPFDVPSHYSPSLRAFLHRKNQDLVPAEPEKLPEPTNPKKERLNHQAREAYFLLTVQDHFEVIDSENFFRDGQSLLFLLVIHELLPELTSTHQTVEQNYLISAMLAHTEQVWVDRPEQERYLKSQIFLYLGQTHASLANLEQALLLTDRSSHDYITLAQSYWAALFDTGRIDEAKQFILDLHRTALPEHTDEIRELLDITFQRIHNPWKFRSAS